MVSNLPLSMILPEQNELLIDDVRLYSPNISLALVALTSALPFGRRDSPLTLDTTSSTDDDERRLLRRLTFVGDSAARISPANAANANETTSPGGDRFVGGWPILKEGRRRKDSAVGLHLLSNGELLFDEDMVVWMQDTLTADLARRSEEVRPRCRGPDRGLLPMLIKSHARLISAVNVAGQESLYQGDENSLTLSLREREAQVASLERKLAAMNAKLESSERERQVAKEELSRYSSGT